MSGGSFGSAPWSALDFSETLEQRLVSGDRFDDVTNEKLQHIANLARHVSKLMREVDLLYAGDTGPESFAQNLQELPVLEFKQAPGDAAKG